MASLTIGVKFCGSPTRYRVLVRHEIFCPYNARTGVHGFGCTERRATGRPKAEEDARHAAAFSAAVEDIPQPRSEPCRTGSKVFRKWFRNRTDHQQCRQNSLQGRTAGHRPGRQYYPDAAVSAWNLFLYGSAEAEKGKS